MIVVDAGKSTPSNGINRRRACDSFRKRAAARALFLFELSPHLILSHTPCQKQLHQTFDRSCKSQELKVAETKHHNAYHMPKVLRGRHWRLEDMQLVRCCKLFTWSYVQGVRAEWMSNGGITELPQLISDVTYKAN